jgi:hypothetical protein
MYQPLVQSQDQTMGMAVWPPNERRRGLPKDEEALRHVHQLFSSSEAGRDPIHLSLQRQWVINIAEYAGVEWDDLRQIFADLDPQFMSQSRVTLYRANHMRRMVMQHIARMSNNPGDFETSPETPDIDDILGAKVAGHFLSHYADKFDFEQIRQEILAWLATAGNAFIRCEHNPSAGDRITTWLNPFSQEREVVPIDQLDDQQRSFLERIGSVDERHEGDLELEVIGPLQVAIPTGYLKIEQMPWMAWEEHRSLDWVWDNYPKHAKKVRPDEALHTEFGQYWRRLYGLVGAQGLKFFTKTSLDSETVTIRNYWRPPSARMPKGLHVVCTQDVLLLKEPHPFAAAGLEQRFPLIHFRHTPVSGRFWGASMVEDLIGPQREYNKARTQTILMRDKLSTPQWVAPRQAQISPLRNDYGVMWEYDQNVGPPQLQPAPPMPQMHAETINQALLDMQVVAAQSEVSQAQVPANVRSGVAIQALQEKDMQAVGPVVKNLESGWTKVGRLLVMLTWKFIDTPRTIRIYGESRQADVGIFKGADINGNVFVRIRPGSMAPKSKAQMQAQIMNLIELGVLQPTVNPQHTVLIARALDLNSMEGLFLEYFGDQRRADIENQIFLRPQSDPVTGQVQPMPDVDEDDDHAVHIQRHLAFKKTDTYELLPEMRKVEFNAHILKHKMAIAQMVMAQMAMDQMTPTQGSPPAERGQPSPPARGGGGGQGGAGAAAA